MRVNPALVKLEIGDTVYAPGQLFGEVANSIVKCKLIFKPKDQVLPRTLTEPHERRGAPEPSLNPMSAVAPSEPKPHPMETPPHLIHQNYISW